MPGRRLSFGPFQVDEGTQVVLREGEPLSVGTRGVRLLEALLRRPGEVVTKAELMDAAWPGTAVEESNLSVQMAALRRSLGEATQSRDWIATVPRVGYRFVGLVEASPVEAGERERPSIAVLPFANLSSDPEQAYFADGLAEEILVALGKLPGILVIARSSSFAYRGDGTDLRHAARDLNVRYVLTGSVRRGGKRLRVSVQLANGETAAQLWAETYDREQTDIFAVQEEIRHRVIAAISPQVAAGHSVSTPGTRNIEALDLYMRGRGLVNITVPTRSAIEQGIHLLGRAVEVDPGYVDPLVFAAIGHATACSNRWTDDPPAAMVAAREAADRAIALAPSNGEAHGARALVAMLEKDHGRLADESEAAMSLSPDSGLANVLRGGYS